MPAASASSRSPGRPSDPRAPLINAMRGSVGLAVLLALTSVGASVPSTTLTVGKFNVAWDAAAGTLSVTHSSYSHSAFISTPAVRKPCVLHYAPHTATPSSRLIYRASLLSKPQPRRGLSKTTVWGAPAVIATRCADPGGSWRAV